MNPTICCKDPQLRLAKLADQLRFRALYEAARAEWIAGRHPVTFPAGTNQMRTYPGVIIGERGPPLPSEAA